MVWLFSFLFLLNSAWAQTSSQVRLPELTSPVVDEAGMLNSSDRRAIEQWIYQYKKQGKAQLQVAIVQDLQGLSIEQYSIELVEKWQLGTAKKDDGVLLLISAGDRQMRIEVGQGLEGALTDLQSKRILDDRVRPLFRSKQYGAGVAAAISEIVAAVDPEYVNAQPEQQWSQEEGGGRLGNYFYLFLIILFIFFNVFGRILGFGGRRRGGVFYGGGFGGGGFGGGGGGGWSGGGGGFSGGGASSNW